MNHPAPKLPLELPPKKFFDVHVSKTKKLCHAINAHTFAVRGMEKERVEANMRALKCWKITKPSGFTASPEKS